MSCVLRVSGSKFAVDDALKVIALKPSVVWHVGEPRLAPAMLNRPDRQTTGFTATVSEKEMDDLAGQIVDAIAFLKANAPSLATLIRYPGVEDIGLDFAVGGYDEKPSVSFTSRATLLLKPVNSV